MHPLLMYYAALELLHMMHGIVPTICNITSPYALLWSLFLTLVISIVTFSVICLCTALHGAAGELS